MDVLNLCVQHQLHQNGEASFPLSLDDILYDGDPVIFTQNNKMMRYWNGDRGVVHLSNDPSGQQNGTVLLSNGRQISLSFFSRSHLSLAYALTIHKMQGSEADTIILPLSEQYINMLSRPLFYTAISRARKKVILVGPEAVLDYTMKQQAHKRLSFLPDKTRKWMQAG